MKKSEKYKNFTIETLEEINSVNPQEKLCTSYIYNSNRELCGVTCETNLGEIDSIQKAKNRIDSNDLKNPIPTNETTLIELSKKEIIADVLAGIVPATVASFSDLHDYVDANCYGGMCEENYEPSEENDRENNVLNALDLWIKNNGIALYLNENIYSKLK